MIISRTRPRPVVLEAWPVLLITGAGLILFAGLGYWWASALTAGVFLFVLWFFRNPSRLVPDEQDTLVSPADGKVVEVTHIHENDLLKDEAIKIGIFMSPLNVHVNRIPYAGKIVKIVHRPGKFFSAFNPRASCENENNSVLLETEKGTRILFVQIAGVMARRIVYWIREAESVQKGQCFGMIKFGSRMDIYLPASTRVTIRPGQKVSAGTTRLGVMS